MLKRRIACAEAKFGARFRRVSGFQPACSSLACSCTRARYAANAKSKVRPVSVVALRSRASSASSVNPSARARFRPDIFLVGARAVRAKSWQTSRATKRRGPAAHRQRGCVRLRKVARPTGCRLPARAEEHEQRVSRVGTSNVCPGRYQQWPSRPSASSRRHEATVFSAPPAQTR